MINKINLAIQLVYKQERRWKPMKEHKGVSYGLALYDDSGSGGLDTDFAVTGSLAQYTQNGGNRTDAETDAFYALLDADERGHADFIQPIQPRGLQMP